MIFLMVGLCLVMGVIVLERRFGKEVRQVRLDPKNGHDKRRLEILERGGWRRITDPVETLKKGEAVVDRDSIVERLKSLGAEFDEGATTELLASRLKDAEKEANAKAKAERDAKAKADKEAKAKAGAETKQ